MGELSNFLWHYMFGLAFKFEPFWDPAIEEDRQALPILHCYRPYVALLRPLWLFVRATSEVFPLLFGLLWERDADAVRLCYLTFQRRILSPGIT